MHCRTIGVESAARFERPAKEALVLATEPRAKRERGLFFIIPVSSQVATFELSENVAIAHVHLVAMRGVASTTASICACARY